MVERSCIRYQRTSDNGRIARGVRAAIMRSRCICIICTFHKRIQARLFAFFFIELQSTSFFFEIQEGRAAPPLFGSDATTRVEQRQRTMRTTGNRPRPPNLIESGREAGRCRAHWVATEWREGGDSRRRTPYARRFCLLYSPRLYFRVLYKLKMEIQTQRD